MDIRRVARRTAAIVAGLAVGVAGLASSSVATSAAVAAPDCPSAYPIDQLQPGMQATGYTVTKGTVPEQFGAEILGVLENGIGPGRHMIIVETSGPAVEKAHGIWFGMSGSPVYINNQLVGGVAYGLGFGPSKLAGLTPAVDMLDVLDYAGAGGDGLRAGYKRTVRLTRSQAAPIARRAGLAIDQVQEFDRLKIPFSVSGLVGRGLKAVREAAEREDLPIIPYTGSSVTAEAAQPGGTAVPGGNFAATISYGDVTSAGIGTTTAVCAGKVLAFGHPFFFQGATEIGANDANAITIWDDPVFGSFKLANVTGLLGTVDQDRLAAIRADLGDMPETVPIRSTVSATNNGNSRDGATDLVLQEAFSFTAFIHMFQNIDVTYDEIGEGSASLSWTVTGTTESGKSFELTRDNMFISDFDISFDSLWEMLGMLDSLQFNKFEDVTFTGFDATEQIEGEVKSYTLSDAHVSVNGGPYQDTRHLAVSRGDRLRVRAILEPLDGSANRIVKLQLRVPRNIRGRTNLNVRGGDQFDYFFCFFRCSDDFGNRVESFEDLLATMENSYKNNELRALIGGRRVKAYDSELLDKVVLGRKRIRLSVVG